MLSRVINRRFPLTRITTTFKKALNIVWHLSLNRYSPLAKQFAQQFSGHDLPSMLAKFSLPVSLAEFRNPLEAPAQEVSLL